MKLIWYPAVSLDGYITDHTGSSDFVAPEDTRQFAKLVNSSGAIIVGRRTFDQYHRPNPFPRARTYVLTQDPRLASDDPAVVYIAGGPLEVMRRLHQDGYVTAVLSGGGETNGLFASKGLIDEAWVSLYPQVHGAGVPLLGNYRGTLRLTLKEGFMLPGGIVHNRYDVG
jgi:dihydrofolate reductase